MPTLKGNTIYIYKFSVTNSSFQYKQTEVLIYQ